MTIVDKNVAELVPYERNPRKNDAAVDAVAASIKEFGFLQPIVIDENGVIAAGHTRLKAAKKLGLKTVPCVLAKDLTPEQIAAFRLADNKTGELATWDTALLDKELEALSDFGMDRFGFSFGNVDGEAEAPSSQKRIEIEEKWVVFIDCSDEADAQTVFNRLTEEGLQCRISTL